MEYLREARGLAPSGWEAAVCGRMQGLTGHEGELGFVLSAVRKLQDRTHCKRRGAWHAELDAEAEPGVVGEVLSAQWWLLLKSATAQPPPCKSREAEGYK